MTDPGALQTLQGSKAGVYSLHLGQLKQLRNSGWRGFALHLRNPAGAACEPPVVRGIFSVGGKDGVKPWMDVVYREVVAFAAPEAGEGPVRLSSADLDAAIFRHLAGLIPPGGHLMVSYEEDDPGQVETLLGLNLQVPPAATPLGFLLFFAGFQYVKNWYLAEGGHEGPRKLWAEKGPDEAAARAYLERTASEIRAFLETDPGARCGALKRDAVERARRVLARIPAPLLSP
ncbi:MAG: DUF1122 family protein [bacterium]